MKHDFDLCNAGWNFKCNGAATSGPGNVDYCTKKRLWLGWRLWTVFGGGLRIRCIAMRRGLWAIIRYTAVIKEGTFHEVGDRIMVAREPVRMFEMTLKRVIETDWPSGGAVPAK